jgi:hypothetical protein
MLPNPIAIVRAIAATVTDEIHKFMWTYTTATQGAEAAERWRRP